MSDDEDIPQLPADTLAILQAFLNEKESQDDVDEDWQLSQFWYADETTKILVNSIKSLIKNDERVALISCPTLMQSLLDQSVNVTLLEFDKRFEKFGAYFEHYDYREPTNINERLHHIFDLVVADPPFLSEECLTKALETVKLLQKNSSSKIILCTGAVMENLAEANNLKPTSFQPRHKNNLANEFSCFTNFGELPIL